MKSSGKIPSLKSILSQISDEKSRNWDSMKEIIAILKEMRFLGFPKRKEISDSILFQLSEIYSSNPNDEEILVKCLEDLTKIDQMNPLIITNEPIPEDSTESYKIIISTLQDMMMKRK